MSLYSKILVVLTVLIIALFSFNSFKENPSLTKKTILYNALITSQDSLFNAYWYANKAEIKTYHLTQSRYGELHQGRATVIFVAQPFLKGKGVKPDTHNNTQDQVQVLKMNLLKKFGTGIYPYSMMLSTFTPLDEPEGMIKASATGQEWCGHIFSQMNQRNDHYDAVSFSYFEEEGDSQFTLPTTFTEDEIWSRIRIDYKKLPTGKIDINPGLYYTRLEQHILKAEKAITGLKISDKEAVYTITYPQRERTLAIRFNTYFPYAITKWEETYSDKRAPTKRLTTTAVLDQSKNIDYWNYNDKKHETIREELGVSY